MSSDLYTVKLLSREGQRAEFRLQSLQGHGVSLGPSFVRMLIQDEGLPGYAAFEAWQEEQWEASEFEYSVTQVEVLRFEGVADEDAQPPFVVELRVEVDHPGALAHLEPGTEWGSTAWDENADGHRFSGREGEPQRWPAA